MSRTQPKYPGYSTQPSAFYPPVTIGEELPKGPCRGFMVNGAGTVNLVDTEGNVRAGIVVLAGVIYPLVVKQFNAGGTATGITAIY